MTTASHTRPCHPCVCVASLLWPVTRHLLLDSFFWHTVALSWLCCFMPQDWVSFLVFVRAEFNLRHLRTDSSACLMVLYNIKENHCPDKTGLFVCEKRASDITSLSIVGYALYKGQSNLRCLPTPNKYLNYSLQMEKFIMCLISILA